MLLQLPFNKPNNVALEGRFLTIAFMKFLTLNPHIKFIMYKGVSGTLTERYNHLGPSIHNDRQNHIPSSWILMYRMQGYKGSKQRE